MYNYYLWDYKKIMRCTDFCIFDDRFPRPPKNIGKPRNAIIYKKHTYFHCRSNC